VQYLLGGHRAFFFDYMDAMGLSRYLPVMVYPKGKPDKAAYFGHRLENFQQQVKPLWTAEVQANSSGALDTMKKATEYLKRSGVPAKRIGIETTFMPMDAGAALKSAMPDAEIKDALVVLERQRLRKSPQELAMLKDASEKVIDSMMAAIAQSGPGTTKAEIAETLRREEVSRGLTFEYCLIAAGTSHNRAPSEQRWRRATCSRSIPVAIIAATSATSPAWRSSASRMRNSRTSWGKSRRSSARRSSRSAPVRWAGRSTRRAKRWLRNRNSTTTWSFWRTAWDL